MSVQLNSSLQDLMVQVSKSLRPEFPSSGTAPPSVEGCFFTWDIKVRSVSDFCYSVAEFNGSFWVFFFVSNRVI